MTHWKVRWNHSFADEPVVIYMELDESRWEVRKVEVFADGTRGCASQDSSTANTALSESPIQSFEEIAAQREFAPEMISAAEFELVWKQTECARMVTSTPRH